MDEKNQKQYAPLNFFKAGGNSKHRKLSVVFRLVLQRLTLTMLWANSADDTLMIFSPKETICMNCQILHQGKI